MQGPPCIPWALRHNHTFAVLLLATLCLLYPASMIYKPFNLTGRIRPMSQKSSPEPQCASKSSVCFLKTHKCASTTVQNILMRYGERNGLTFALPPTDIYLGHPALFNRTQVMGRPPFDMLVQHTRFQESELRAVLKADAVFVTIVREPASLFESLFSYYNLEAKVKVKLEQLPSAMKNASLTKRMWDLLSGPHRGRHSVNQMSFDLGFDVQRADNSSAVQAFVEHVDAVFDLVMVAERMNESLVLLRHLLCWDVDDVVAFRLNARQNVLRRPMSSKLADELRSLNAVDLRLYEHFARRFEQRVQEFGRERMEKELKLLELRTQFWYQRCVAQEVAADKRVKNIYEAKVMKLQTRNTSEEVCYRMTESETQFTKELRFKQLHLYNGLREGVTETRLNSRRRMGRSAVKRTRFRGIVNGARLHRSISAKAYSLAHSVQVNSHSHLRFQNNSE